VKLYQDAVASLHPKRGGIRAKGVPHRRTLREDLLMPAEIDRSWTRAKRAEARVEQTGTPSIAEVRDTRYCHELSDLEFPFQKEKQKQRENRKQ